RQRLLARPLQKQPLRAFAVEIRPEQHPVTRWKRVIAILCTYDGAKKCQRDKICFIVSHIYCSFLRNASNSSSPKSTSHFPSINADGARFCPVRSTSSL